MVHFFPYISRIAHARCFLETASENSNICTRVLRFLLAETSLKVTKKRPGRTQSWRVLNEQLMSFLFLLYVSLHQQFGELWHEIETIQPPQLITYAAQHGGHVERWFLVCSHVEDNCHHDTSARRDRHPAPRRWWVVVRLSIIVDNTPGICFCVFLLIIRTKYSIKCFWSWSYTISSIYTVVVGNTPYGKRRISRTESVLVPA